LNSKDAATNLGQSSDQTFTTSAAPDTTAPVISNVVATPAETSVVITWDTNENASSIVDYGPTNSYGTSTAETDTSPRVTSHSVTITGLTASTTYHYRVKSNDASSNLATGSDGTFTTSAAPDTTAPVSETSALIRALSAAAGALIPASSPCLVMTLVRSTSKTAGT
jgi:phosphodiesterase/alkaline phosphatase D-like protein